MKVGILTIQSNNIGNRLQNFALQEYLTALGVGNETILRHKRDRLVSSKHIVRDLLIKDRYEKIRDFNHRYISWSKCVVNKQLVSKEIEKEYDAIIIGSDQIWNPYFPFSSDADYIPELNIKKIAYAASFGVDKIEEESLRDHIIQLLNGIEKISMREYSGVELIGELTGRKAEIVIDPTLLINKEIWLNIMKRPGFALPKEYLLKYMLGESNGYIDEISKEYNCSIIDLQDKELPVGPCEFIYLIKNAKIVCTDSFHASVFSFIFGKPFVIFERISDDKDMSSRLETLCKMFGLWDRRFCSEDFKHEDILTIDYNQAYNTLDILREESGKYLKNALGIV